MLIAVTKGNKTFFIGRMRSRVVYYWNTGKDYLFLLLFFWKLYTTYFYYTLSFFPAPPYPSNFVFFLALKKQNKQAENYVSVFEHTHAYTHVHTKKRNHGVWFTLDTYTWAWRLPGVWLICTMQPPFINQLCQNTSNVYNSVQVACKKIHQKWFLSYLVEW